MEVILWVENKVLFGLVDTGTQISLMNLGVIRELESGGIVFSKRKVKVRIHGIGEEVKIKVKLRENFEAKHPFVVLRED